MSKTDAIAHVGDLLDVDTLAPWNDREGRTLDDVLNLLPHWGGLLLDWRVRRAARFLIQEHNRESAKAAGGQFGDTIPKLQAYAEAQYQQWLDKAKPSL